MLILSVLSILIIVNALYFLNIIPPIPLSLKDAGVYHTINRVNGEYHAVGEPEPWFSFFKQYEIFHQTPDSSIYIYSAVFSPANFNTDIIHEWQHKENNQWVTKAVVPLSIVGGRDSGFRTYSTLSDLEEGLWRVNVKTLNGLGIGRVSFEVVNASTTPAMTISIKK